MSQTQIAPVSMEVDAPRAMSNRLILTMAIACGLAVANLYYIQPLLADIGRSFSVSVGQIGFIATLSQLGYASGLLLIVPLGDNYNQRKLIVGMLVAVTVALAAVSFAPGVIFLAFACYALGLTTVVPQLIIPYAASLAPAPMRGRVVGTVMSGLLIGILLARTVSGFVGTYLGWRSMYWIAAIMMILLAVVLRFLLPDDRAPKGSTSYPRLLQSLWGLWRSQPVLRETGVFGALVFGSFSAFWVILSFVLETPPYHFGSEVAGLFGLVGVAGALAASVVGRFADRGEARHANGIAISITLFSFVLMWLTGQWLAGLIVGVLLLDLGTQANQVASQSRVYSLIPEARNRLNTVYMTLYFVGGSLGSLLGTWGWSLAGWNGVCGVACMMLLLALALYIFNSKRMSR
ncbi:MFS transporter [Tengunoibacter tsumagoiensis]|uniref:Permease n=1 Tax=Tengunoibacter tsumagoiensis TaxID=2014871 RepID=A0A401ZY39_9CHLR|nr:MFS transporter [Tengunoibacter tsumagoiensis]GCE11761.1 permease [Tengunoibacter tsumagoiensis]